MEPARRTKEILLSAYYELSREAERLCGQKDCIKAAEALAKLKADYSDNADDRYLLE